MVSALTRCTHVLAPPAAKAAAPALRRLAGVKGATRRRAWVDAASTINWVARILRKRSDGLDIALFALDGVDAELEVVDLA